MELNLPPFDIKTAREPDGRVNIYDCLRQKYVALTLEEMVRQAFVAFLIGSKGFPSGRMANEVSLRLNGTARRSDTVVFDSSRRPLVIVEYKAPHIQVTQRVFDQIVRYNMALRAKYLIVSNGMEHYCCRIDYEGDSYQFLPEIPEYSDL